MSVMNLITFKQALDGGSLLGMGERTDHLPSLLQNDPLGKQIAANLRQQMLILGVIKEPYSAFHHPKRNWC